tara:strand:- start:48 stop:302 length:255 start_codon:yes stop_codon:yes gene_type:complete
MAKRSHTVIAEHFGADEQDIKEYEYQPGRFTRKVFALTGNDYWSTGKAAPTDRNGVIPRSEWVKVQSSYDPSITLWKFNADKQQ